MADIRPLNEHVSVGSQVWLDDIETLKVEGVTLVICNRPDGELPDQPTAEQLSAACAAAGLSFLHIPMTALSQDTVEASVKAYAEHDEARIHAFCGSGTRSTVLWCFSHVKDKGVNSVIETASAAGYQLHHIAPALTGFTQV